MPGMRSRSVLRGLSVPVDEVEIDGGGASQPHHALTLRDQATARNRFAPIVTSGDCGSGFTSCAQPRLAPRVKDPPSVPAAGQAL